jgi:hypothetical protein
MGVIPAGVQRSETKNGDLFDAGAERNGVPDLHFATLRLLGMTL